MTITRRSFLKYGVGASAALAPPWPMRQAFATRPPRSLLTKYIRATTARGRNCGGGAERNES